MKKLIKESIKETLIMIFVIGGGFFLAIFLNLKAGLDFVISLLIGFGCTLIILIAAKLIARTIRRRKS